MQCQLLSDGSNSMVAQPPLDKESAVSNYSNLGQRAWCFQERINSSRILVFRNMGLSWICNQGQADEWKPEGEATKPGVREGTVNPRVQAEGKAIFGSNSGDKATLSATNDSDLNTVPREMSNKAYKAFTITSGSKVLGFLVLTLLGKVFVKLKHYSLYLREACWSKNSVAYLHEISKFGKK